MQRGEIKPELAAQFPDDWEQPAEPEVNDWLLWVWRAWHRLSWDRPQHGGGLGAVIPGRISWRAIMDYADRYGYDGEFLDKAVVAMDETYLAWCEEKRKK